MIFLGTQAQKINRDNLDQTLKVIAENAAALVDGDLHDQLIAEGARVLGDGEPKTGAHGKPVLFLHPKDFNGTLIELEEV